MDHYSLSKLHLDKFTHTAKYPPLVMSAEPSPSPMYKNQPGSTKCCFPVGLHSCVCCQKPLCHLTTWQDELSIHSLSYVSIFATCFDTITLLAIREDKIFEYICALQRRQKSHRGLFSFQLYFLTKMCTP